MNRILLVMGALAFGGSALVHAATQIDYQINGGSIVQCDLEVGDIGNTCILAGGSGVTLISVQVISNAPGSASSALQSSATLDISNSGTSAANLNFWFTSTGFSAPTTPPALVYLSNLSLTAALGTASATSESCVNTSNGLESSFCSPAAATLYDPTAVANGSISSVSTSIASLTMTPYSLQDEVSITLGANSNINLITSQSLTPVPEPTSILMLGGVLVLAGGAIRRKLQKS